MIKCALDCDPGHDDLAMIMLAVYNPKLEVEYISTCHGNQTVNKTYINARRTLNLIHKADKIPVYKGYSQPLIRKSVACPEIHGDSGLEGVDWTEIDKTMPKNPALEILGYKDEKELKSNDFFIHLHKILSNLKDDEKFNIISTASQTNTAQYLLAFPEDAKKIRMIVMGGNFLTVGNIAPFAEFNIMIDPESVNLILNSGVEYIFAAPLDITHTVLINESVLNKIKNNVYQYSNKFYDMLEKLLLFFKDSYFEIFDFKAPPLHDPVAAFYLIEPEWFESKKCHVDIETKGEFTYGCCCTSLLKKTLNENEKKKNINAIVCLKLKEGGHDAFWNCIIQAWTEIAKVIGN